jgi:uncharacterized protein (TIGR02217 family)
MPTHGRLIFPENIITSSSGGTEFATAVIEARGAEARVEQWSEGRQRISLAGCTLTRAQHDEWIAFRRALRGMAECFLFRDIRECRIVDTFLDTTETANVYQVVLKRTYQGRETKRTIRFLDHDYYPRFWPDGRPYWPTNLVEVKVGGVTQTLNSDYTVERETGLITFASTPASTPTISCWFYTLMRFGSDWIGTEPQGGGVFVISSGEIIEPKGNA